MSNHGLRTVFPKAWHLWLAFAMLIILIVGASLTPTAASGDTTTNLFSTNNQTGQWHKIIAAPGLLNPELEVSFYGMIMVHSPSIKSLIQPWKLYPEMCASAS